jgi:hypothetical protein
MGGSAMNHTDFENDSPELVEINGGARLRETDRRLSTLGWALFFIWIGLTFLLKLNVSVALLGLGVITLGVQLLRKAFRLPFESFWLVVGLLLLLGGLWIVVKPTVALLPLLLIVAGLLLLVSVIRGKKNKT